MKQIKLIAVALLLVVLVGMPAFAGQVVTTGASIAYEILGAARNVSLTTARPVGLTLGNTLQNSTVVTMTLSGGALFNPGQTYYLCANNTTQASVSDVIQVASGAAAATNTILPLPISGLPVPPAAGANVLLGLNLWLTSNSACNYPSGAFNFTVGSGAAVGSATLSGNVTLTGTSTLMDTFAANNVATISRQYTTTLSAGTLVAIDYITGPSDGTTLVASAPGTNLIGGSNVLTVANASLTYNVTNVSGAFNQVLTLTDSHGDWAGLSRVFVGNGDCVTNIVGVSVPASGNIVLHYPNAANNASNTTLCINVAGNVAIPNRSITGTYAYEVATGTGLNLPAAGASAVWQTWTRNGYQAFNPYMYVGTSQETLDVFCRFYNSSTRTAQVFVDVYPADGSAAVRYTLDSIPSNTAGLYWGSTIGALASLSAGTSYAALFTVTATPAQINGVSFFKRSTGERQLPLYKSVVSTDSYLSQ